MSLRIHFTCDDLARTIVAPEPDPLWEVLLSLHLLQTDDDQPLFGRWRRHVRRRLQASDRRLLDLAPPDGYSPDFLTPAESAEGFEQGLAAIEQTPTARLAAELARLVARGQLSPWMWSLAAGDSMARRELVDSIRRYHRIAVAPYWTAIRREVHRDLAIRSRAALTGGFTGFAGQLHPDIRWSPPRLEVRAGRMDRDIDLAGRSLRIVPSIFCRQHPIMLGDPRLPQVLVHPVDPDPTWVDEQARGLARDGRALAALLGRTRAAVLGSVAEDGCSTSELARRLGISPASASEHASVLHQAGLIRTYRVGAAVRHTLSPTGAELVP
jgi:DNA-binding transcriptional ArsR family regulator